MIRVLCSCALLFGMTLERFQGADGMTNIISVCAQDECCNIQCSSINITKCKVITHMFELGWSQASVAASFLLSDFSL